LSCSQAAGSQPIKQAARPNGRGLAAVLRIFKLH
jgi:hypothetical protein